MVARKPDNERNAVIVYLRLPPPLARELEAAARRYGKRMGFRPSRGAVIRRLLTEHLAAFALDRPEREP